MSNKGISNQQIGHFELHDLLGRGGMGEVYRALDLRLGRYVALKVMRPEFSTYENLRQRFHQEAKAIAALGRHPNIITIYEFSAEHEPFIAMEYIATGSLRHYIKERYEAEKLLSILEVMAMIQQIASALDFAHQQKIYHRDVKPDNILLGLMPDSVGTRVNAILTDFGLVKLVENSEIVDQTNQPIGTPAYMAPEQFSSRPHVDGRTDIYSLGIMFYELIAGQRPFSPRDIFDARELHHNVPPPDLNLYRPGLHPDLIALIMKCLAKKPDDRFQTGRELIEATRDFESRDDTHVRQLDEQAQHEGRLDNLETYIASIQDIPNAQAAPFSFALAKVSQPQVLIQNPDGSTSVYILEKDTLMIGRSAQADLILQDKKVSNRHALLTWDGGADVTIADNDSTNFTYLDSVKLLKHTPQTWLPGQVVSIGPFRLIFQVPASDGLTESPDLSMRGIRSAQSGYANPYEAPTRQFTLSNVTDVSIDFSPPHLVLEAGGRGDLFVTITNKGTLVEHYKLELDGIPPEWLTIAPDELHLMPDNSGTISVGIFVPRRATSEAGRYDITLRALKSKTMQEIGFAKSTITIQPYYDVRADIEPMLIRQSGVVSVMIHNRGNSTTTYMVVGRDPSSALTIRPREHDITLENGQRTTCEFQVDVRQDLNFKVGERFPVVMRITPSIGDEISLEAQAEVMGRQPDAVQNYQVITPDQKTTTLELRTDMIAMHLKAYLIETLRLPQGDYTLINGKTGDPLLPGQTLPEAGIQRGGVLWVKREISTVPEPEPVSPPPSPAPQEVSPWMTPQQPAYQQPPPQQPYYQQPAYAPPAYQYQPQPYPMAQQQKAFAQSCLFKLVAGVLMLGLAGAYGGMFAQANWLDTEKAKDVTSDDLNGLVDVYEEQLNEAVDGFDSDVQHWAETNIEEARDSVASTSEVEDVFENSDAAGLSAWEIFIGRDSETEAAFTLEFDLDEFTNILNPQVDEPTIGKYGINEGRPVDWSLIAMPITAFFLGFSTIVYGFKDSGGKGASFTMLVLGIFMLIYPFAWENLSTRNWANSFQDDMVDDVKSELESSISVDNSALAEDVAEARATFLASFLGLLVYNTLWFKVVGAVVVVFSGILLFIYVATT